VLDYIVRRLLQSALVVVTVSILLFGIMQLMPGDPIMRITGDRVPLEVQERIRAEWGLDQPLHIQYIRWFSHAVRGNFGQSIITGQDVFFLVSSRMPFTLMLSGIALMIQYIIGIPIGLLAAYKRGRVFDQIVVYFSTILWSVPPFWLGVLLVLLFAMTFSIFPVSGFSGFMSLVLPLMAIALPGMAAVVRMARAEAIGVFQEKMVVTAYAKGLPNRAVLFKHVLRNAMIPTTIMFFLSLPWVIGGSIVIETIFAWPGMGQLLWRAINQQDYPVVQGIVIMITILTVISNTIGDLLTGWLDPRIRNELRGPAA